ncbi:hypothetical protein [Tomitella cavernea]|uniref:Transcriptional regulator n=1 Tax=Tomitella cavernea TaxID=1387982 RepID=A0ABP9C5R1_9ACTN|nr:hypothetical protein [Tomitella cavernea]
MSSFGVPPRGPDNKHEIAKRLKQAKDDGGAKVTIDWRGEQRHLHVISVPVSILYFNPDTHRIRVQRTLDPERNKAIDEDPWGHDAQDYLRDLLCQRPANPDQVDPEYTALMDELDDVGQREPGIISPDGVLVDGNTRAAALIELGVQNIKVGVLPDDTSRQDINNVELSLQLRKDRRREYSYINRLVAIEEELGRGRTEEDVAKDFNIRQKTLQCDRWVYNQILDAIERSRNESGAALRLVDFEQHQEKLRELYRDYTKLATKDSDAAERLRHSRLAMVILDYPKTSLRLAESDFYSRYLETRLPPELKPATAAKAPLSVPGIPGVALPAKSDGTAHIEELANELLRAKATCRDGNSATPAEVEGASSTVMKARDAFNVAVKLAGQNAELVKRQLAVPERLSDAAEQVTQCAMEFAEAKAKRALDDEAFDEALIALRDSLASLGRQARRTYSSPGEGVAWLLDSIRTV